MTANGEWKIIAGCALIVVSYGIYMTCTPNPGDGAILAGIVGAIAALVGGVAAPTVKKIIAYRRLRYD